MSFLKLENVSLEYPVYGADSMSLRHQVLKVSTGGLVAKSTSNQTIVKALNNINIDLTDGDCLGIVGHNGSGKSSLLRLMAGIYHPTQGKRDVSGNISTVLELGAGIDGELTGKDNILRMAMIQGFTFKESKKILKDVIEFAELGDFINMPVRTYSSGMTMRIMFGVATSTKPEIFIVDEMISTGDKSFQEKAINKIKKIASDSKIFILASHDENMINELCNKVIKLEHGSIVEVYR